MRDRNIDRDSMVIMGGENLKAGKKRIISSIISKSHENNNPMNIVSDEEGNDEEDNQVP